MNVETKVGIFVIIGFFMVAVTAAVFGNLELNSKEGKTVYFRLNDATGIRNGTPIMYKGLKVGEVKDVMMKDNQIITRVNVYHEFDIPDNVRFNVKQSGFVGQKFVEFEIDPAVKSQATLKDNYEYDGRQSNANMDAVMAKLNDVAAEMTVLLKTFNEVVTTDQSKNALQDSIANLKDITDSVKNIVASNDKNIQEVIENAKNMTAMIDRLLAKNEQNLNTSINNITEISQTLKAFTSSVDKLLANNKDNIDGSLKNLKDITDKVNSTMDDIEKITNDINNGNGTLGMLINDNQTKNEVKKVVSGVSSFFGYSNSEENEDRMSLYATIGADYLFDAKSVNTGRGYAQASFYTDPRNFYLIGVSNIPVINPNSPEYDIYGNKIKNSELAFSLQYSHIFYNVFGLRFGIFDNTLGLATDFYPLKNKDLAISLEAYDFNTYSNGLDLYTRAYIRWHFYKGMFIQAGVEDVIGYTNRMYMVGAGVRFKPSELGKLANNMEKNNKSEKRVDIKEENKQEPVYKEYKETKKDKQNKNSSQNTKQNNNEVINIENKPAEKKENKIEKKQDKKKIDESDEFFDSLVY
ncbi:MAG: MlaD family protein [Mucispirillum sp.]|uniref:MCE family protein n=1 Tax=Candidatus Mucispirillum faecigallinarum TaxID=2838699 RepID=A0A9D2GUD4_9BACT|nr:MlaD family protein [Mucispirillum sp.]HIZ89190.1 MCE family protein [Candidatus Mucispirillum faecigallinarum]